MKRVDISKLAYHLIPNIGTIVVVALMLFTYTAWAAPQMQIASTNFPYQGTLTDTDGNPIIADMEMSFRIYGLDAGGTHLWEEVYSGVDAVPVKNGLFQVMLGSLTPIPGSVWNNDPLYLGIQVGGDPEMEPRELIGSVPRAIQAEIALTVPIESIGSDQILDASVLSRDVRLSNGSVWPVTPLVLTSEFQEFPGTTITLTPDTDQTYLVFFFASLSVTDGAVVTQLYVDDVKIGGEAVFHGYGGLEKGTVSQGVRMNLSAGTHTLVLKAKQWSGPNPGKLHNATIVYFAVAQ
jgi:hypothetical protein